MKIFIAVLAAVLILADVSLAAVGATGSLNGTLSSGAYTPGLSPGASGLSTGYMAPDQNGAWAFQGESQSQGYILGQTTSPSQLATIPLSSSQAIGPYQDGSSPEKLGLAQPQPESFQPEGTLDFASAASPQAMPSQSYGYVSNTWYYPASSTSANRFYVQTSTGLSTKAGCSYGGHLPLWAEVGYSGYFYVCEWYPGQREPSITAASLATGGYMKGWFTGDVPGWHTLCYFTINPSQPYTPVWSNYIYIYVWPGSSGYGSSSVYSSPAGGYGSLPQYGTSPVYSPNPAYSISPLYGTGSPYSSGPIYGTNPGDGLSAGYGSAGAVLQLNLPQGAPTPPNPNSEPLTLPDVSQLQQVGYSGGSSQSSATPCPECAALSGAASGATTPQAASCPTCQDTSALGATGAYVAQTVSAYHEVYPTPSTCRCNQYYIQTWPGRLSTTGSVQLGGTAYLLSKISKPGTYWSFEWTQCGTPTGYYCQPEVRCFGYKGVGWQQTVFRGDTPGWHLLLYYCEDWSNWAYIYVWPR
jgi:hypothetical protein